MHMTKYSAVRISRETLSRLQAISERTGIPMARIASDGIEKEIKRIEAIFKEKERGV